MKKESGFTVIEILVTIALLAFIGVVFFIQKNDLQANNRDYERKTAINAMYYDLTEVYYPTNKYYPAEISKDTLKAMDPELFTDPDGYTLNGTSCDYVDIYDETQTDGDCNYSYEGIDCNGDGQCKGFKLTSQMEREAEYTKESSKN